MKKETRLRFRPPSLVTSGDAVMPMDVGGRIIVYFRRSMVPEEGRPVGAVMSTVIETFAVGACHLLR